MVKFYKEKTKDKVRGDDGFFDTTGWFAESQEALVESIKKRFQADLVFIGKSKGLQSPDDALRGAIEGDEMDEHSTVAAHLVVLYK